MNGLCFGCGHAIAPKWFFVIRSLTFADKAADIGIAARAADGAWKNSFAPSASSDKLAQICRSLGKNRLARLRL